MGQKLVTGEQVRAIALSVLRDYLASGWAKVAADEIESRYLATVLREAAPARIGDAPQGEKVEIWTEEDFGIVSAHPLPRMMCVDPSERAPRPAAADDPDGVYPDEEPGDGTGAFPDEEYPDEAPAARPSQLKPIRETIGQMITDGLHDRLRKRDETREE